MTTGRVLYRARAYDTPDDPFSDGAASPGFRYDDDLGLAVSDDGVITARGPFASVAAAHPDATVIDLRAGILLPGLVDTHVHFPQVRVIGALGMPLMEWLERSALPEEQSLAAPDYAATIAGEFVAGLIAAGTTTSLVFGSHFAPAVDALFTEASRFGLRVTSGLVVSDRMLPEPLLTTPDRACAEAVDLASRWHGRGRARYAVTPRFSLSASDPMLAACAAVMAEVEGAFFTSHVNENLTEVATVAGQFPERSDYVDTYDHHGLLGPARCSRTTCTLAPPSSRCWRSVVRRWRTARAATRRSAPGSSACASTWRRACPWRSAATSAPAPASRCSRRACRPTSCSACSARRVSR